MNYPVEQTFRTKTGTCTITHDKIILKRRGVRGAAAKIILGNSIKRVLLLNLLLGIAALLFGIYYFRSRQLANDFFFSVIGIILLLNVLQSLKNSATPVVDRSSIRDIRIHSPRPPITRGYFTVIFQEGGKLRKRLIMLPGSMENGNEEFKKAVAIFKESGLLNPEQS